MTNNGNGMLLIELDAKSKLEFATQFAFVASLHGLLSQLIQVHQLLEGYPDMQDDMTLGLLKQDILLVELSKEVEIADFGDVEGVLNSGVIGSGDYYLPLLNAVTNAGIFIAGLKSSCENYEYLDDEAVPMYAIQCKYRIGALVYSMSKLLHVEKFMGALSSGRKPVIGGTLQQIFDNMQTTYYDEAKWLLALTGKYRPVIPVFESSISFWDLIVSKTDSETLDQLLNLQDAMYEIDVRALERGHLEIDEEFIAKLNERLLNEDSVAALYPDEFAVFCRCVPDALIPRFYEYENKLPLDIVLRVAAEELPVTEDTFRLVDRFIANVNEFTSGPEYLVSGTEVFS